MRQARLVFTAAALCSALGFGSGCRSSSTEAPKDAEAPENALPLKPPELSLSQLEEAATPPETSFETPDFKVEVSTAPPCQPVAPFLPPPGRRRVQVQVKLEAKSQLPIPVSPLWFHLETPEGRLYDATLAGCGAPLQSRNLGRGESAEGTVSFDVPQELHRLLLVYQPFLVGRAAVKARLALPRGVE